MGWTKKAKEYSAGKWIKFTDETPSWTVTFQGDPVVVEKISTMGDNKGKPYDAYEFPVEVAGKDMILSVTQRSLLRQLIEEEEAEPLPGRTLQIKCLDLKTKKEWKIREVKPEGTIGAYAPAKPPVSQAMAEPEAIPEAPAQDEKAKEKFKEEVEKRTKSRKKKEAKQEGKVMEPVEHE